jgi:hypothetical protein
LETAVVDRLYSVVTPTSARGNVRQFFVLYADHGRIIRAGQVEELLEAFEGDLDFYIASNSQNCLFVHAGAVQWNGRTIVLPGRSRTGKTTLAAGQLAFSQGSADWKKPGKYLCRLDQHVSHIPIFRSGPK